MNLPKLACQHLKCRGIIERFKALECREHIRRADADAVVFQQCRVAALRKDLADLRAKRLAAGNGVFCNLHLFADMAHGRDQIEIRQLADDGERHKRGRVRMQHGIQVRAHAVDRFVERQLGRGLVRTFAASVRVDADDVLAGERPFVDAGRGDPDVALCVADRKIAAGHGGQALVIDALHEHDKLVGRMDILNVQKMTSQSKKSERQNAVKGFVEQRLRVSAERCTVAVVSVKQSFALRRETGTSSVFSAGCGIEQLEAQ